MNSALLFGSRGPDDGRYGVAVQADGRTKVPPAGVCVLPACGTRVGRRSRLLHGKRGVCDEVLGDRGRERCKSLCEKSLLGYKRGMERTPYPSDVTDAQWQLIEPMIPPAKPGGRRREVVMREVVNGILYLNRAGCQWRAIPRDLPPWGTVHYYCRRFRLDGSWQAIHDRLRERVRVAAGKEPTPSAAVIDSQSVKTTEKGGYTGTTRARRSTVASGTPWSTRSA